MEGFAQKAQSDAHNEKKSKEQWSGLAIQSTQRIDEVLLKRMERAAIMARWRKSFQ